MGPEILLAHLVGTNFQMSCSEFCSFTFCLNNDRNYNDLHLSFAHLETINILAFLRLDIIVLSLGGDTGSVLFVSAAL